MNVVRVLELAMLLCVVIIFATQIAYPLYRGTRLFPWFKRERKLEAELADVRQQKEEQKLQKQIDKEKQKFNQGETK